MPSPSAMMPPPHPPDGLHDRGPMRKPGPQAIVAHRQRPLLRPGILALAAFMSLPPESWPRAPPAAPTLAGPSLPGRRRARSHRGDGADRVLSSPSPAPAPGRAHEGLPGPGELRGRVSILPAVQLQSYRGDRGALLPSPHRFMGLRPGCRSRCAPGGGSVRRRDTPGSAHRCHGEESWSHMGRRGDHVLVPGPQRRLGRAPGRAPAVRPRRGGHPAPLEQVAVRSPVRFSPTQPPTPPARTQPGPTPSPPHPHRPGTPAGPGGCTSR
jgi:hypothetical protein